MAKRKTWREKLADNKGFPKIAEIMPNMSPRWGTGTFVIPAPAEVDEIMRRVPKGKLITINEIRALLATKHRTTIACPITTGIFAWIAANAAQEEADAGKTRITPYWRTLKTGGLLNEKYPGGISNLKKLLAAEGHKVVQRGNKYYVVDYQKSLVTMSLPDAMPATPPPRMPVSTR
ncbi:MAG: hypothetical protein AB1705_15515 [Verrucomicrobiota bacterium]